MKRTELKRGGPLKRKTPLRRVSAKRAALMRAARGWREQFIVSVKGCQICRRAGWNAATPELMEQGVLFTRTLCVHEIARGSSRSEALKHRACCLVVCGRCNTGPLCDYSVWPIERQLCVKLLTDPNYFDLDLFNKVRGRASTAITLADIAPYLELKA